MGSLFTTLCTLADAGSLTSFLNWFAGDGKYHTLLHCMNKDWPWVIATVSLDIAVAMGYLLIARHWWVNERTLPDIPARRALRNMRNIFFFCGICGYVFIPIKMFWPAWRLYDIFMVVLLYFTWKYAWSATELKVIYAELGKGRRLEQELERSREESQQKSFFLNAISHDLRTPLNGLMLQVGVADMSLKVGDAEGLSQSLADIKASARSTADLLNALLEYARMDWATEPANISSFRLADLLDATVDQLRAAAGAKGIALSIFCIPKLTVMTDNSKLARILMNLAENAVKFTERGSVRLEVESVGQAIEIHIIDTGVGISAESRTQLFDEFYQVNNHERDRRKGFGMGLAIARRLARQLGGDILVDSAPGRGSRFTVALPDAARRGDPGPASTAPVATPVAVVVAAGS